MKRVSLIPEIKQAWRFASVRLALLVTGFGLLPGDTQVAVLQTLGVPPDRVLGLIGLLFLLSRLTTKNPAEKTSANL